MYQQPQRSHAFVPRPAGDSDSNSSEDEYDVSGFTVSMSSKSTHRNGFKESSCNANNSSAEFNGHVNEEDWEISVPTGATQSKSKMAESWGRSPIEAVRLACMRGNLVKLKQLFSNGYTPGVNDFFGGSEENPLITACMHGHHEIVEYLLGEKKADPNLRHPTSKTTALMTAVGCLEEDKDEMLLKNVKALVDAGANMDMQDRFGMTALMIAIKLRRSVIAQFLLEKGANPNIVDPDGHSALFFAAMDGDGRMCRLLLEHRADLQLVDKSGWSPPDLAQDKGYFKLADFLFMARDKKWKPGCHPALMAEDDDEAIQRRREARDADSVREESSIDIILTSVDGTRYLKNFRRHKISYIQFLKLDEEQLKEIGVDEVGVRTRILDHLRHIQNAQWQNTSLRSLALNKNVTAAEAVCMVVNIKEHLEHISSSLQYLGKRIKDRPLALQFDVERNKIDDLMRFTQDAEMNCSQVSKDLIELHSIVGKVKGYTELQIKGMIEKRSIESLKKSRNSKTYHRMRRLSLKLGAGMIILGFLQLRWNVLEHVKSVLRLK